MCLGKDQTGHFLAQLLQGFPALVLCKSQHFSSAYVHGADIHVPGMGLAPRELIIEKDKQARGDSS